MHPSMTDHSDPCAEVHQQTQHNMDCDARGVAFNGVTDGIKAMVRLKVKGEMVLEMIV